MTDVRIPGQKERASLTSSPISCMPETTYIWGRGCRVRDEPIQRLTYTSCPELTWFSFPITMRTWHCCLICSTDQSRDHFDQKVEQSLRRDFPIISTPHAKGVLTSKRHGESFSQVFGLETYQQMMVTVKSEAKKQPRMRVTAMPGKHVSGKKLIEKLNEFAAAVCPRLSSVQE